MKTTISQYEFERAFVDRNRSDNFSYKGKKALFEYFEQYEVDTGEEIELDVIALCCEYTEYDDLEEFQHDYGKDGYETIKDIENSTMVIKIDDDAFIIQSF